MQLFKGLLTVAVIIAVWILLQRVVLPRMGVAT